MSTVLITGATGALGTVVTEKFLKEKWGIIATTSITKDIGDSAVRYVECDITDYNSVEGIFEGIESLDAVVHLVGGIEAGTPIENTSSLIFEKMLSINLRSTFNVLHFSMPLLKVKGGSIVTIGARDIQYPTKNRSAYFASKSGVVALTLAAAEEGKNEKVRANVILPSVIRTAANMKWASNGEDSTWVTPESITETIYFLCSDSGVGINGSVIPMYGQI
jgi:NAD(P)-dependent dehydrogenase (short-subunit alcohol dehydrogenase family)